MKIRENSNFHENKSIQEEVENKGFSVYNYISLSELLLTIKKDYLNVLIKLNIVIPLIALILYFIFSGSPKLITIYFYYFGVIYLIIFIYLFLKLIPRTYNYFLISDVVFTKKGVMLGRDFISNSENLFQHKKIVKYAEVFDEYLTKPSTLHQVLEKKKIKLIDSVANNFTHLKKGRQQLSDDNDFKLMILGFIVLSIHAITMYIAYYVGIILGLIFFTFYALIIKIVLFFKDHTELKIKHLVAKLDQNLYKLALIYKKIDKKLASFSAGNISNLDKFVEENFEDFYMTIGEILSQQKKLEKTIKNSKYREIIDFKIFAKYLKAQYNKPVKAMSRLLKKHEKHIGSAILAIKKQKLRSKKIIKKSSSPSFFNKGEQRKGVVNLELSKKRLEMMNKNIKNNLQNLAKFELE